MLGVAGEARAGAGGRKPSTELLPCPGPLGGDGGCVLTPLGRAAPRWCCPLAICSLASCVPPRKRRQSPVPLSCPPLRLLILLGHDSQASCVTLGLGCPLYLQVLPARRHTQVGCAHGHPTAGTRGDTPGWAGCPASSRSKSSIFCPRITICPNPSLHSRRWLPQGWTRQHRQGHRSGVGGQTPALTLRRGSERHIGHCRAQEGLPCSCLITDEQIEYTQKKGSEGRGRPGCGGRGCWGSGCGVRPPAR